MAKTAARLFTSFHPEHYDLSLSPDSKAMKFSGSVTITGQKVGRPSQRLVFHQKDLTVTSATISHFSKSGQKVIETARINHQRSLDEVRLHANEMLYPAKYEVTLEFHGKITRDMQGIYPSFYTHEGKDKVIISTQFESHHAREAFPCIDEPEAKATFDLHLAAPKGEQVLSNMPSKSQKPAGKLLTQTSFKTSPKMSTYLLAFGIGELHYLEAKTKAGTIVRSWASIAQPKELLSYSVAEGVKILEFFSNYFGTPYPLEKYDQLALPDFDAGAMENWGMITFREIALLADPKNRSVSSEQFVSLVVAHEASHMWFGDLVTMKWWDDLWLNESFASLMEHLVLDNIHPDWHQWEMYSATDILSTTGRDIYSTIQPVGVVITDPELIETAFDPSIVYAKGGRLLKMLREYIGDPAFARGLQNYFKKHAYGNTTREDLWQALTTASGKDIGKLMTPWIVQPGMPVLHINQEGKNLKLSQERFTLDVHASKSRWPIPLLANQELSSDILNSAFENVSCKGNDFVLFNQYGSGHYISHYQNPDHRAAIVEQIEKQELPTEARINVLNDSILLARHGDDSLTSTLDIIAACGEETRDAVWGLIGQSIGYARQLTDGNQQAEDQLKSLRKQLATSKYKQLGWNDKESDDPNTKQLRHTMIAMMVGAEDDEAIASAIKIYEAAKKLDDIPAEIRNTILGAAVRFGDKSVVTKFLEMYATASVELQHDICGALASTKDPKVGKRVLNTALGEKGFVRPQDLMRWLVLFLRNPYTRDITWEFLESKWAWVQETFSGSKSFDYLPTYCASIVTTDEWAKKYKDFFEPKRQIKKLEHNIIIGYADVEARVAWRKRDEAAIAKWLSANTK